MSSSGVVLPTYSQDCGLEDQTLCVHVNTHRTRASTEVWTISIGSILATVAFEPTWQANPDHIEKRRKPSK